MAKAWMPLYVGDYLGDTSHLTQGHHGAYLLLMMHYWQKGMLQASLKHCFAVARAHAPEEQQAVEDVLQEFFILAGGFYQHRRIDAELSRVTKVSVANKEKAVKAANARWNPPSNAPSIPQALLDDAYSQSQSHSQSDLEEEALKALSSPEDEELKPEAVEPEVVLTKRKRKLAGKRLESFKLFWDAFSYKSGKAEAADSWLDIPELRDSLVAKIVEAAKQEAAGRPALVAANRTPKMAQGWLTSRRWEDEARITPAAAMHLVPAGKNAEAIREANRQAMRELCNEKM